MIIRADPSADKPSEAPENERLRLKKFPIISVVNEWEITIRKWDAQSENELPQGVGKEGRKGMNVNMNE